MSWLSSAVKWFEGIGNNPALTPATKQALQPVQDHVNAAATALETALPALASEAVNAGLALIPGNAPFIGTEELFMQAMLQELTTRLAPKVQQ